MHPNPSDIEPELRSPPPREIHARLRERLVRWLFVNLGLILPWLLTCLGYGFHADRSALRAHGVPTTGWVVEKHPGGKKESPQVRYYYKTADRIYVFWNSELPQVFETLWIGQEVPVLHLVDRPSVGALAADVRNGGHYSAEMLALWLLSAILAAVMVPCWLWLETVQRRLRHLARNGIAVRTTAVSVERGQGYRGVQIWWVAYEFELNGRTSRGRTSVIPSVAEALSQPGVQATVLYDPAAPNRFEAYPAITTLYQVLPMSPELSSGSPRLPSVGTVLRLGILILVAGLGVATLRGTFDLGNRPVSDAHVEQPRSPDVGEPEQRDQTTADAKESEALERANQLVNKSNVAYESGSQFAAEAAEKHKELFSDAKLRGFPGSRPQLHDLAQQTVDLFGKAAEQYRIAAILNEDASRQGVDPPRVEYLSLKVQTFRKIAEANEAYQAVARLIFDESIQDANELRTRAGRLADHALQLFKESDGLSTQADESYGKLKGEVK